MLKKVEIAPGPLNMIVHRGFFSILTSELLPRLVAYMQMKFVDQRAGLSYKLNFLNKPRVLQP